MDQPNRVPSSGRPADILGEGTERATGIDARRLNVKAGQLVAEAVRTTLGPNGMDKMVVVVSDETSGDPFDPSNDVTVTNDGITILEEVENKIDNPAAELVIDVARVQENEVGDGTTSAVVVAGELLSNAEDLLDRDVHPTSIVQGYRQASERAVEALEEVAVEVGPTDRDLLVDVAATSMAGKGPESARRHLAELVVDAVRGVAGDGEAALDDVYVETVPGESVGDSRLVEGFYLGKEPFHNALPREVADASVVVYDGNIKTDRLETDSESTVADFDEFQQFRDEKEAELREMVDRLVAVDADAVIAGVGIDQQAHHFLAEEGILSLRYVDDADLEAIARVTGAEVTSDLDGLTDAQVGHAQLVSSEAFDYGEGTVVSGTEAADVRTIVVHGGTDFVVDEVERAVRDALRAVTAAVEDGRAVPGGGAPEMALARDLRGRVGSVEGREQLAVEAFADALETIPRTLAESTGLDPVDALVGLRSAHDAGEATAGVDVLAGERADMVAGGVLEPFRVKAQYLESATEATTSLLRVDDVISTAVPDEVENGDVPTELPESGASVDE